ncbi:hypothetical protein MANES_07G027201v8 [Manihot esculenta]|uniref:Uncharacterized protein n=1 Tax=Manihot esculenta TaxID=3983 RepID=A0ACB7HEB1_MANES|nr:hypothetical protein MANES_07G027201v8 [Manihot esculenta]
MNTSDVVAQLSSIKNKLVGTPLPRQGEVSGAVLLPVILNWHF